MAALWWLCMRGQTLRTEVGEIEKVNEYVSRRKCLTHVNCLVFDNPDFAFLAVEVDRVWQQTLSTAARAYLARLTNCRFCAQEASFLCVNNSYDFHGVCMDHVTCSTENAHHTSPWVCGCSDEKSGAVWPNPFRAYYIAPDCSMLHNGDITDTYSFHNRTLTVTTILPLVYEVKCWKHQHDLFPTVVPFCPTSQTKQLHIPAWRIAVASAPSSRPALILNRCHCFWTGSALTVARQVRRIVADAPASVGERLAVSKNSLFMFFVSFRGTCCYATCSVCKRTQLLELFAQSTCCLLSYDNLLQTMVDGNGTLWQHMQGLWLKAT